MPTVLYYGQLNEVDDNYFKDKMYGTFRKYEFSQLTNIAIKNRKKWTLASFSTYNRLLIYEKAVENIISLCKKYPVREYWEPEVNEVKIWMEMIDLHPNKFGCYRRPYNQGITYYIGNLPIPDHVVVRMGNYES